jgi:hypothetical protein
VALCGGDAVRPDDACEIALFNTRTARRIRAHPPELRRHRIVGFTDGLVILLHKSTTAVRVLHPLTRIAVDLPPLARVYRQEVDRWWKHHLLDMNAVVCDSANSPSSITVVVWFRWREAVFAAEAGDSDWKVLYRDRGRGSSLLSKSMLPFQDRSCSYIHHRSSSTTTCQCQRWLLMFQMSIDSPGISWWRSVDECCSSSIHSTTTALHSL